MNNKEFLALFNHTEEHRYSILSYRNEQKGYSVWYDQNKHIDDYFGENDIIIFDFYKYTKATYRFQNEWKWVGSHRFSNSQLTKEEIHKEAIKIIKNPTYETQGE